jgi:glycosyltransferase involved in cell wall biosynthesis
VELIRQMGGRVYELPRLTSHPLKNLSQLYHIVKDNKYRIVIRHTSNALVTPQLLAAKLGGAYTICHSHNETDPNKLMHRLGKLLMNIAVSERFACSEKAGKWMYGNKNFRVINNAININKFRYSKEKADKVRAEFGLENNRIYGHIANFIESKNHMYLLEIYKEISKLDENARFFCLGEGSLRPEIEAKIKALGLEDKVFLTGIRHDAQNFMSCFDVLIFPSVFEGLPLTLIEAQAAGLPCLISDTITKDVEVTSNLVTCKSIEDKPAEWAKEAVAMVAAMGKDNDRKCQRESIAKAGYDVEALAKWYEKYFVEIAENKGK